MYHLCDTNRRFLIWRMCVYLFFSRAISKLISRAKHKAYAQFLLRKTNDIYSYSFTLLSPLINELMNRNNRFLSFFFSLHERFNLFDYHQSEIFLSKGRNLSICPPLPNFGTPWSISRLFSPGLSLSPFRYQTCIR